MYRFALLLTCALASVASAAPPLEDPSTPGFVLFAPDGSVNLDAPPPYKIEGAGMEFYLEPVEGPYASGASTLLGIRAILGGKIYGLTSEPYDQWLCYTETAPGKAGAAIVWFRSSPHGGGDVEQVIVEAAPKTLPVSCVAPKRALTLTTGLPGLGATEAEVTKAIGAGASVDGLLAYKGHIPHQDMGLDFEVVYRFENGVVSAFEIAQFGSG